MIDLKRRQAIRKDEMESMDVLMTKMRAEIQKGWIPQTPQEFASALKMVTEYGKKVGRYEETKDILEKIGEGSPMMEKVGVQCQGNHLPDSGNMDKKASGDLQCRYCGVKLGDLHVSDSTAVTEKQAAKDAKGAVEKMFGG